MKLWQRKKKWRFKFENVANNVEIVHVEGNPDFYKPLSAPHYKEEVELRQGYWLVLFAAVWNSYDVFAIQTALPCMDSFEGKVRFGIRTCSDDNITSQWYPGLQTAQTPLWAFFADGEMIDTARGTLSAHQLIEFVTKGIEQAESKSKTPDSLL